VLNAALALLNAMQAVLTVNSVEVNSSTSVVRCSARRVLKVTQAVLKFSARDKLDLFMCLIKSHDDSAKIDFSEEKVLNLQISRFLQHFFGKYFTGQMLVFITMN
jgi:hypothetical protein